MLHLFADINQIKEGTEQNTIETKHVNIECLACKKCREKTEFFNAQNIIELELHRKRSIA